MNSLSTPARNMITIRSTVRICAAVLIAVALLLAPGCASQATFPSPEKAVDALVAAAHAKDSDGLKRILGPQSDDIICSGDQMSDKRSLRKFLSSYEEKHQIVPGADGAMTLLIGNSDWPVPIPIVRDGTKWRFDAEAGREEILNRRIGRNELAAIQTCHIILDAQREYLSRDNADAGQRGYAVRFISEPGKKNGLYWPVASNEQPSPLGPFAAALAGEGYKRGKPSAGSPRPYHGYRFRILTRQGANASGGAMDYLVGDKMPGGFAIIAWPAEYGNSGIMTFIMSHAGKILQCDLGEDTAKAAESTTAYNPGPEWKPAETDK